MARIHSRSSEEVSGGGDGPNFYPKLFAISDTSCYPKAGIRNKISQFRGIMTEQGAITTETVTVWEYEYKGEEGNYWLPESTEERTLERARYRTSTGRVRSQERTITTVRGPWTEFVVSDSGSGTHPQD